MTDAMTDWTAEPVRLVGDYVLRCSAGVSGTTMISGGAVDVGADGRIVAVGAEASLGPTEAPVRRLGGLLMPGLVNGHCHTPMSLMRSAGEGLPLDRWLVEGVWPREGKMTPEDAWWGMALGSIEMLRAGVTTSAEMYLFEDQLIDAVQTIGARLHMMAGLISVVLPDQSALDARLAAITELRQSHDAEQGLITVGFGPHSAYDMTPEQLAAVATAADATGAMVHIHVEETAAERALVQDRYGRSATQVLADAGLFQAPVSVAHGVWLDGGDLAILADGGASVIHCPQSNLKLGSGIADVPAMLEADVAVGLGTDGPASNDNLDLWEEMRLAPMLARGVNTDPGSMTIETAIGLATRGGGEAIGMVDVGDLTPGKWADIIRIDLDQPAFQPALPDELLAHLVWAGGAEHVTDVWVGGRQVVDTGEVTTIDRHQVQREVFERARRLL